MPTADPTFLENEIRQLQPFLVEVRRHIHAHPEIGADQPATVAYLARQLEAEGAQLRYGDNHVGLVVDIEGARSGPTLAFRADTDALELTESEDPAHNPKRLGFRSTVPEFMHGCGHDAHSAILAGLGRLACARRDKLRGRLRLLFQPGEEGFHGAARMIAKGYLKGVDNVFALHCHSGLNTGQIGYRPGSLMAAVDAFTIKILGTGGHGASPHNASDQVLALCRTVENLQTIVARRIDPLASAVVSVCYLMAGSKQMKAVVPASVEFGGTVRTLEREVREQIKQQFLEICETSVKSVHPDCHLDVDYHAGYGVTVNDSGVIKGMTQVFAAYLDDSRLLPDHPPLLGSEDFSAMLEAIPGAMFFLGVTPPGIDPATVPFMHHPAFDIDETALAEGLRAMANLAFRFGRDD